MWESWAIPRALLQSYSWGVTVLVKLMIGIKEFVVAHEFGMSDALSTLFCNGDV